MVISPIHAQDDESRMQRYVPAQSQFGEPKRTDVLQEDSIVCQIMANVMLSCLTKDMIEARNGKVVTYIVDRGETWESIATKCRVDASFIKSLNPYYTECITGTEILIAEMPEPDYAAMARDSSIRRALIYEESGEWKKAIKAYSEILKGGSSVEVHYLRGRAYYRANKLKESVQDFEYVVNHDNNNDFPDASDVLAQVSAEWEQKKAQKAELWGNIIGGVLQAGAMAADAYLTYKYGTQNSNAFLTAAGTSFNYSPSMLNMGAANIATTLNYYQDGVQLPASLNPVNYFTPDMMKMEISYDQYGNPMYSSPGLADAMMKMQADFNNTIGTSGALFTGSATSNMINGLVQSNNNIVIDFANQANTFQYFDNSGGSYNYDNNSYDTSSSFTTVGTNSTGKGSKNCPTCMGTGRCQSCNGTGWIERDDFANSHNCANCKGSKKCQWCRGTGKI